MHPAEEEKKETLQADTASLPAAALPDTYPVSMKTTNSLVPEAESEMLGLLSFIF